MKTKRKRTVNVRINAIKKELAEMDLKLIRIEREEEERLKRKLLSEGMCPTKIKNEIKWIRMNKDVTKLSNNLNNK